MRLSSAPLPALLILTLLGLFSLTGCVAPQAGTTTTVTSGQNAPTINEAQAESYNGPKARIAVSQFKDKTGSGWWTGAIGNGMADQLTTALFNSNRFIVLERETLGAVMSEQDLGASGRIQQQTAAPIGQIEGAELLVVGAVTEFSGNASGGGGGLGGIGSGVFGAIAGGFKKSHMAIDLRIIDSRTSRVLAATSVEGEATDVNLGGALGGYGGSGALAGALGGWKNTPTEKALRICIQKAVEFIISKTPQTYYHFGAQAPSQTAVQPVQAAASDQGGLTRDVVRQMQSLLASLGYDVGVPDGIAGKKTRSALLDFQKKQGLPQTGILDPDTMKTLREVSGNK
ncbi:MAG: CsgG/HfaB family protein [Pseudomonadota bacterium]